MKKSHMPLSGLRYLSVPVARSICAGTPACTQCEAVFVDSKLYMGPVLVISVAFTSASMFAARALTF